MRIVKIEFKYKKEVLGRTFKKCPKVRKADEMVYGLEVKSGILSRVVQIEEFKSQYQYLYFATKKSSRLPKDKEIFRLFLAFEGDDYFDEYEIYVFNKEYERVGHIYFNMEGICRYLMREDADDEEGYIDEPLFDEVIAGYFGFDPRVEFYSFFDVEELEWQNQSWM